jgi:hypothetical protein
MGEQDYIDDLARRIAARLKPDRQPTWEAMAEAIIESALAMIAYDICAGREVRLMYLGQLKRLALPDGGDLVVRYRACDCLLDAATCPCHQEGSHERT